jgi:dipeptidase D
MKHPLCFLLALAPVASAQVPSPAARRVASLAVERYSAASITTLAELVAFDTFVRPDVENASHPSFRAMSARLKELAESFGLDFEDHGAVVVIGLGDAEERLGVVTHGDVQPATASRWARDPFELDRVSEPGLLVGRGTEDDKGPIVCALYALRTMREEGVALSKRIELIISYTEESDWGPFQAFLAENPPPQLNVAFDAEYPVVIAEKGWCTVTVSLPLSGRIDPTAALDEPHLASFTGGFFLSQVPASAQAVIANPTPELEVRLRAQARADKEARFRFTPGPERLTIDAEGTSAHSSKPWEGTNAITHLARLLGTWEWAPDGRSRMVRFINDRVGTGFYGELFGELAHEDPLMGPLTLSLGLLEESDGRLVARINLRRPIGRTQAQVEDSVADAIRSWVAETGCEGLEHSNYVGAPHPPVDAPHIPILLDTFRAYTGIEDAKPISIGGGTHARLVPNGVNFGPSMPGEVYTGHSEHEFISEKQFLLNLEMYTSLLVDLASR